MTEPVDFFLDIETLGTKPGAMILEIGAWGGGRGLDLRIDIDSQIQNGKIELETLKWWSTVPSIQAKHHAFSTKERRWNIKEAIERLNTFISESQPTCFWGCSPDFDYGLLQFWYDVFGIQIPWKYYQLRDVRTVREFLSEEKLEELKGRAFALDSEHMANADAYYEKRIVEEVRKKLEFLKDVSK